MIRELADLARRLAELERRMAASGRSGTVSQVDAAQGLIRLDLGEGMLSPWVPYVQTAGALKVHSPPSVGQQMILVSPSGETSQGYATALSFGGDNGSPSSSGDEHVVTFGGVRLDLTSESLRATIGGVTLTISGSGVTITGGSVTHDGKNIGSTHTHGGVDRGDKDTDPPN